MDASAHFRGKKITVMGLGLLGGVGDIRYLAESGADLIVTDLKTPEEARPSLDALKDFPNIKYTLGRHELEDFRGRDLIVKAPSTPADSPYIEEARKEGTSITMWAALFCSFARAIGAPIVGVTGTRGKTTTTAMLASILETAGKEVITGGNVAHTAMLPNLSRLSESSHVVLELDSWKLQGFAEQKMSPDVSVFTTFFPDHLNYYGGSMEAYLADKANIFLYQRPEDTVVFGSQCVDLIEEKYRGLIPGRSITADTMDIPMDWHLQIPGEHNRYDAACALVAARVVGVEDAVSRVAIENFRGVPGRLEFVRDVAGVKVYNDTTATTPDATLAALKALDTTGGDAAPNIVLIMGGADKNLDMNPLLAEIPKRTKRVIMLAGTGTSRVLEWLPEASVFDSLGAAVREALHSAVPGDTVLFSPAFASFGMFKNEYDRGDQFNAIIQSL